MEKDEKVDVKTLLDEMRALKASIASLKEQKASKVKGDGRVVEAITKEFASKSEVKAFSVRAGNVENKNGKIPGVLGVQLTKWVLTNKGKFPDSGVFVLGSDIDALIAHLSEARAEAKSKGYF